MESNIRKLRRERKISQEELGKTINVSQQIVSRMERDRNCITVRSLIALADYFDVSTDEVLGYQAENQIKKEKSPVLKIERTEGQAETKPLSEAGKTAVYDLLISMKRCMEEYGI